MVSKTILLFLNETKIFDSKGSWIQDWIQGLVAD